MYYPIMLDLSQFHITIIGGGRVAYRKACSLLAYKGSLTVISPSFIKEFEEISDKIKLIKAPYDESYLKGSTLVIAATDDKVCNDAIGNYCATYHLLCNVVSNEALSSFIVPSSVQRGDLTLAVSTNGKSPALARKIKEELEVQYDTSYEEYVSLLGEIRQQIKEKVKDEGERKELLKGLLALNISELKAYKRKLS